MKSDQPATLPVALGGVLSTGVALAAILFMLDPALQTAIIAFGNSIIFLSMVTFLNQRTTSSSAPVVEAGTEVAIRGSSDTVIAQPTPPGPEGIEGGSDDNGQ
jgi:hypothetical protein